MYQVCRTAKELTYTTQQQLNNVKIMSQINQLIRFVDLPQYLRSRRWQTDGQTTATLLTITEPKNSNTETASNCQEVFKY